MKNRTLPIIVLLSGLALLYPMQRWIDETSPHEVISEETLYFTSGKTLKKMSLGLDGIVADIYWMRTVQYFGGKLIENKASLSMNSTREIRRDLLAPYLNIITELDPHQIQAYRFGAIFLPERDLPAAVALLERGIAENPENWRLYQDLGYIYWQEGEYEKAAEAYERGGQIEGAAWWMRDMAGFMRIKGGSRDTARAVYSKYAESEDPQIRKQATLRLEQLTALDELDVLNALMTCYREQTGRCPDSFRVLIAELRRNSFDNCLSAKLNITAKELQERKSSLRINNDLQFVDPEGVAYVLNDKDCKIELAFSSSIPRS